MKIQYRVRIFRFGGEQRYLEVTKRIRFRGGVQPFIIAMTASAMKEDRELCFEAGMDDYISKPFVFSDLVRMLEKWGKQKNGQDA